MNNQKRTGILSRGGWGKCISYALTLMLTLAAFLLPSNAMADEPWVEYNSNTTTLTFKYGAEKPSSSETVTVYALNEGSNRPEWTYQYDITSVVFDESFANARPTTCYGWFNKLDKLTNIEGLKYLNTENVTNMSLMFSICLSLEALDLSNFKTANVTDMSYMFDRCSVKNLDLSSFNTANVTKMDYMFYDCSALTTLDLSNFNTSNVTDMNSMFNYCGASSLDLSNFNTANVTYMSDMFENCFSLETLDLSSFNTANVTKMSGMFYGCKALTTIFVNQFDIKEGANTNNMFYGCTSLVGAAEYDANYTDGSMANYTTGYFSIKEPWAEYDSSTQTLTFNYGKKPKSSETVPVYGLNEGQNAPGWSNNTCTSVVFNESFSYARPTTCYKWFYNQQKLTNIEGLQYLNTEEVTDMFSMFEGCKALQSLDLSGFNTEKVANMRRMFYQCTALTDIDLPHFNTSNVTDMANMFYDCKALTTLDLSSFNTANVTNMSFMFCACSALTTLDLSNFNTANVTNMSYMFSSCYELTTLDLSNFNTANVTDMSYMFKSCLVLTTLDLSNFNTANVKNMTYMFSSCYKLTTLDLSNFNTANVKNMTGMFSDCYALTTIYTSNKFDIANVLASGNMFSDCKSLVGAAKYDTNSVDATMANYKTGYFTLTPKATAYAEYDSSTQTLTFKYDLKPESSGTVTVYGLNKGDDYPGWNKNTCTSVVFDESFSYARPTTCYAWFLYQENLTNIEGLQYLNTENVTNMSDMFSVCSALRNLDLSNFNTANVTNMDCMFYNCNALATIYVSDKFDITKVNSCVAMFEGCTSLVGAVPYNEDNTDAKMANCETGYFTYKTEAWAEYDSDTQKLTFKYGRSDKKPESSGTVTVYGLNEGNENPGWYNNTTCKSVVFDESFSKARPTSCCSWFSEQYELTNIEGLQYLNTENVTNMVEMFAYSALENLDLSNFNTEKVTDMSGMFEECHSLETLDLSNFNTANVTDMTCMFYGCTALETLDLSNFNTANVTSMTCMFYGCSALNTIYVSDKFDITKVYSSNVMFEGCKSLVGAVKYDSNYTDANRANYTTGYFTYDKEAWVEYDSSTKKLTFKYDRYDTKSESSGTVTVYGLNEGYNSPGWNNNTCTSVVFDESFSKARPTTCYKWFYNQRNLTSIEGLQYLNTEKVTDMSFMFCQCISLANLDLSKFNTANVTAMGCMFQTCYKLNSLDFTNFNTENVTEMFNMFLNCSALTSIDLSTFNTANVTDMTGMFGYCTNLKTIYVSDRFDISKVENSNNMFSDCTSLVGAVKYDGNNIDASMANYKTGYFTLTPKATAYAEYDSSTQTLTFKYDLKPESSGTVTVYGLNEGDNSPEWYGKTCTSVVFDESFSKARPTTCYYWFFQQYDLKSIEGLQYLNTENVTNMYLMFSDCYLLENIDLSNFNTKKVTDMGGMFRRCLALTTLDLSTFSTANVTDMRYMFAECPILTNIYVSDKFDIAKVLASDYMFYECNSLVGAASYNASKINGMMANYKTGYFKTYYRIGDTKHDLCGETLSVTDLVLEDGKDFVTLAPFTATNATYSRTMTSNWGTLCLPFAVETTSTADSKFYGIESVNNDVITLSLLNGAIAAGTPVLVYSTNGLNISASDVDVLTSPAEGAQANGWQLVGSFAETEVPDDGYIISKNKFWLTSDLKSNSSVKAVKTKGLRAWLKSGSDSSEAKAHVLGFAFDDEDETSAIDAIDGLTEGTAEIYDMQGRRIDHLQKGLNIVKMGNVTKKVMVK